jgi:hypothetical protein
LICLVLRTSLDARSAARPGETSMGGCPYVVVNDILGGGGL